MRKVLVYSVGVALTCCLVVFCSVRFSTASVTILVDGQPLKNTSISQLGSPLGMTDDTGTVFAPDGYADKGCFFISHSKDRMLAFTFPSYGNMELRLNGPVTQSVWTKYDFGFIKSTEESISRDFSSGRVEEMLGGRPLGELTNDEILNYEK